MSFFYYVFLLMEIKSLTIVMSYRIDDLSMTHILVIPSRQNSYAPIERFHCLSLKAIEFKGVDTTGFPKNFVVLVHLFKFIDILKSY